MSKKPCFAVLCAPNRKGEEQFARFFCLCSYMNPMSSSFRPVAMLPLNSSFPVMKALTAFSLPLTRSTKSVSIILSVMAGEGATPSFVSIFWFFMVMIQWPPLVPAMSTWATASKSLALSGLNLVGRTFSKNSSGVFTSMFLSPARLDNFYLCGARGG